MADRVQNSKKNYLVKELPTCPLNLAPAALEVKTIVMESGMAADLYVIGIVKGV